MSVEAAASTLGASRGSGMRLAGLLVILTIVAFATHAGNSIDDARGTPLLADVPGALFPEEVVVSAPEPRYVAPTQRDRIGRIWAPVYIDGKGPFRLVLDTGANRSVVTYRTAQRLGKAPDLAGGVQLHGVTGTARVPTIKADSVEVGDLLLNARTLPVVHDVFGGAEGALGTEGLADKRIVIDFKNDSISILRSKREGPPPGFSRVPVKLRHGRLLMFQMYLGGVKTWAMLDTGAQMTIGNNSLREALARRARKEQETEVVGVTLDIATAHAINAPPVEIGGIRVSGMQITFGDLYIFEAWKLTKEPALLIGMDVIGVLDSVVIDYRLKELHLKARY
jgi:predicted aspartyl protease